MSKPISILKFFELFPSDGACLEHLMTTRYGNPLKCPSCGKEGKFHKRKNRPIYECQWCSHAISPMAGTPFEASRTPLVKWFYAMYLFTTSRHGVPAKELQRQLSVTYKTAWRMGHEIRKYMAKVDGDNDLDGHVEIDETYVGGYQRTKKGALRNTNKTVVFGMLERGGDLMTKVVPNAKSKTLIPLIEKNVEKGSTISSDDWRSYRKLPDHGYKHGYVMHGIHQWKKGIHHTNSIEGFWSQLKRSIKGTHIHVSKQHMAKYLGEFEYRYNMRANPALMFDHLLKAF